ncbi:MAG: hypothetical protein EPO20_01825 [Betaproteobacteria bacterium]|nr:MAG: hypothetical protein EPO20_01825 [Betaproteobacteria bacterium]
MRKSILPLALAAASIVPAIAAAQAPAPSPVTGNLSLVSDYRFRGLSQTMTRPAVQGGFDYAHASGIYLGNWNSNVSSTIYPNANLEMDFYGGYKRAFGDLGLDLGFIYYYYPGSKATLTNPQTGKTATDISIDNKELYVGGTWKWLSLKYYHSIDDFFAVPDTQNSWYLDGSATFDLGSGWGVLGHVGHQKVKSWSDATYTDYKLGVTKDISGFVFGAALVDTNAKDVAYTYSDARKTMNIGKSGIVLSVSRTF